MSDEVAVVTIVGIVIAIVLAALGWFLQYRKDTQFSNTKLVIKLSNGLLRSELMLFVEVGNASLVQVSIKGLTLIWNERMSIIRWDGTRGIPLTLAPNDGTIFWISAKQYAVGLKKAGAEGKVNVKAAVLDGLDKAYYSKTFHLDIEDWMKE